MTITRWVLFCRRHSSSSASSVGHSLCRDVSHSDTTSGSSVRPGIRISSHGPGTPAARHLATCSSRLVPSSSAPAARSTRAASGMPSTPFITPHTRIPIPRQREITASALLRRSARSNSNWGYCRTATPPVYVPYELNLISIEIQWQYCITSPAVCHTFSQNFPCLFAPGKKKKAPQGFLFLMYGCLTWQPEPYWPQPFPGRCRRASC